MRKHISLLLTFIGLLVAGFTGPVLAQQPQPLGNNAALQYYAAFFQMVDADLSDADIKELSDILAGARPYDDARFGKLAESNADAIETMMVGAGFPDCDWGLAARSEKLGWQAPVGYFGKSRTLGRLDILYVLHVWAKGDQDKAVSALAKGMVFVRQISSNGPLMPALLAKQLLMQQFAVAARFADSGKLTPAQRVILKSALAELATDPIDWQAAANMEMQTLKIVLDQFHSASDPRQYFKLAWGKEAPPEFHGVTQQDYADLAKITAAYATVFRDDNPATVRRAMSAATMLVQQMVPAPDNTLMAKHAFEKALEETKEKFE
jgi:hypothetical protein